MMGLYLDCVDVKELWVLKMKKNVPYDLSLLIVNTTDKLYLIVAIPEMPPFGMIWLILHVLISMVKRRNLIRHLA